jgi:hypothetical protein
MDHLPHHLKVANVSMFSSFLFSLSFSFRIKEQDREMFPRNVDFAQRRKRKQKIIISFTNIFEPIQPQSPISKLEMKWSKASQDHGPFISGVRHKLRGISV